MMTFWIITAALIVAALALLAVPLLRKHGVEDIDRSAQNITIARERLAELEQEREQDLIATSAFEEAKLELEKVLAGDLGSNENLKVRAVRGGKAMLGVLAVVVPVLTIALYNILGSPQYANVIAEPGKTAPAHTAATEQGSNLSMEAMSKKLSERLQANPDDADGWFMLGRTYMVMKDYPNAVIAFEQLQRLIGDEPQLLLSLADAVAMAQGGSMRGRPTELVEQALAVDPNQPTGLWMAGIAASEGGDFKTALDYFERLKPQVVDDPESLSELSRLINGARQKLGLAPEEKLAPATAPAATGASLTVEVTLSPELTAEAQPGDTVFIYAKAQNGPPMPLAVARKKAADLPITVTLDDSMAMTPQMRLSAFDKVKIGARVSKSGNAITQSGDLVGEVEAIEVGRSEPVTISISQQVP